jgi:hypothetical protein
VRYYTTHIPVSIGWIISNKYWLIVGEVLTHVYENIAIAFKSFIFKINNLIFEDRVPMRKLVVSDFLIRGTLMNMPLPLNSTYAYILESVWLQVQLAWLYARPGTAYALFSAIRLSSLTKRERYASTIWINLLMSLLHTILLLTRILCGCMPILTETNIFLLLLRSIQSLLNQINLSKSLMS